MTPASTWEEIAEDCISQTKTTVEACRIRHLFKPRVRLTIDRYGRFALPLSVRRGRGLGRLVTLELVNDSLAVKPEVDFERTLEFVRTTNAELEAIASRDTPTSSGTPSLRLRRGGGRLKARISPERIPNLSAQELEAFVYDRFWEMGFRAAQVGQTFEADGGFDLLVCSGPLQPFPHLLAVQITSHVGGLRRTDEKKVKEFFGALESHSVTGGVLITNSTFTKDARQFAERHKQKLWLRDIEDLIRWTQGDFRSLRFSAEVRSLLQLRKGVSFSVKEGLVRRRWEIG